MTPCRVALLHKEISDSCFQRRWSISPSVRAKGIGTAGEKDEEQLDLICAAQAGLQCSGETDKVAVTGQQFPGSARQVLGQGGIGAARGPFTLWWQQGLSWVPWGQTPGREC